MSGKIFACALVLAFVATPVFAAMDCENEFRVRVDKMAAKSDIRVPTNDMVASTRFVLQGYDACMKGDMTSAKSFFDKASKSGD